MAAVVGVGMCTLTIALAVLGIPPILTNAFVGIRQVDRATVEAARGHGHDRARDPAQGRGAAGGPDHLRRHPRRHDRDRGDRDDRRHSPEFTTLGDFIINRSVYGENGVLAGAIVVALLALVLELAARAAAAAPHSPRV